MANYQITSLKLLIASLFAISLYSSSCTPKKTLPGLRLIPSVQVLDTIIEKTIPLTLTGEEATFRYHLMVNDWRKPVRWEMRVVYKSTILLEHSAVDSLLDGFFWDSTLVEKKSWYLSEILSVHFDTLLVNDWHREFFHKISKEIAKNSKTAEDTILVNRFWVDYQSKDFLTLVFFFDPVIQGTPMLSFYPEANKFIPIYAQ